jgi:3-hydroxybutyryl-CoA dehydrogenase
MHFFNPAPVMKLVEVVRTVVTEPSVVEDVEALAERLGKVDVTIGDKAGFIANALLFGYLNHAVSMYENRYASREDIDAAMRLGCGLPMGPLALMDLIGLDTAYEILDTMYKQSRDRLHAPAPDHQADDDRRPARPEVRPRLLHLRRARTRRGRRRRADTPAEGGAAAGRPPVSHGRRRRLRHDGHRHHRGRRQGRLRRHLRRPRPRTRSRRCARRWPSRWTSSPARQARPRPTARRGARPVTGTTSLDDLADVDLVIEAVVEDLAVKQALFANLDEICKPGAVLATTTSSACRSSSAPRPPSGPADVVGMHFFNPAPVMKLVEVVSTIATAPDVAATAHAVCAQLGKHAVSCTDRAGFIVNALLFPYLNDAVKMLEAHYATADDIDTAMKVGCGYPMGPFELLDVVGLDVSLAIQRELYHRVPRARLRAGAAAGAPGHRRLPRPQDRARLPGSAPTPSCPPAARTSPCRPPTASRWSASWPCRRTATRSPRWSACTRCRRTAA